MFIDVYVDMYARKECVRIYKFMHTKTRYSFFEDVFNRFMCICDKTRLYSLMKTLIDIHAYVAVYEFYVHSND